MNEQDILKAIVDMNMREHPEETALGQAQGRRRFEEGVPLEEIVKDVEDVIVALNRNEARLFEESKKFGVDPEAQINPKTGKSVLTEIRVLRMQSQAVLELLKRGES